MKQLDLESQFILYFIREQDSPVKRRGIERRYPRMTKSRINYRLNKMRKMGLIKRQSHQEYGEGVNPTYQWSVLPRKIKQYEEEHARLATPAWKWQEFSDKWFDAFETRLKRLEQRVQDG
jgi:DNA-binding HxlR family transcriptional regulator